MRILVLPLMFAALICLCSCSDTYNEPVYLSNQEGLSDVYTDRPLYSSLYYEGTASNVGQNYHVFVLKIISKFHPVKTFNIYYLPLTEFTFRTTSAEYQGKDAMTFAYHFSYDHDAGIFKLSKGDSRQGEMVKANFTEKFTLREEKCITAKANALENPDSFPQSNTPRKSVTWLEISQTARYLPCNLMNTKIHLTTKLRVESCTSTTR